jgi:AmiR/NasT family two-component response regulator
LLQDVKDLNQLTEQLEERAKIEEAKRWETETLHKTIY